MLDYTHTRPDLEPWLHLFAQAIDKMQLSARGHYVSWEEVGAELWPKTCTWSSVLLICMLIPCSYHTLLITVALYYFSKLASVSLPTVSFFFKIVLILKSFAFPCKFRIRLLNLYKRSCSDFVRNYIASADKCGRNFYLNHTESSTIRECFPLI